MAKKIRPSGIRPTPVMLDKERTLYYNNNAQVALEEKLGINCLKGEHLGSFSATRLRAVVWAGLLHETPDVTEREVGDWIPPDRTGEVVDAVLTAWGLDVKELAREVRKDMEAEAAAKAEASSAKEVLAALKAEDAAGESSQPDPSKG